MDRTSGQTTCGMEDVCVRDSDIVPRNDGRCQCNCHKSVKILTVISVISCVVCLMCMFTLLYFLFINKHCLESKIVSSSVNNRLPPDSSTNRDDALDKVLVDNLDEIKRVIRAPNATNNKTDKKKRNKKKRRCKCRGRRGKQGATGDQGPQGPRGEPAKPLLTAHYTSNFEKNEKKQFNEGVKCIELSGKTVCRNRTIIMPKNTRYDFLSPAFWYDERDGPLMQRLNGNKRGIFVVQQTGIYLMYSTTHYYDSKRLLAQTILINGDTKFRCLDGIDYVKNQDSSLNRLHKTCSVSGVTKLEKGDEIEVQNVFHDVTIDITKDRTYFGVVLLHD